MNTHLYLNCFRHESLIMSQLEPEDFGSYMAVGSRRKTRGRVMFLDLDIDQIDRDYFRLDQAMTELGSTPDGSARRSGYVSIHRVMEHVPRSAMKALYLTTPDGLTLQMLPTGTDGEVTNGVASKDQYMYVELSPTGPRVVSTLAPAAFGQFMTDMNSRVAVPRLLFADQQLAFDAKQPDQLASYLPYRDEEHIADCLRELKDKGKEAKIVDRDPPLSAFYRTIDTGFFVADSSGVTKFAFPDVQTLDAEHFEWWRSAQVG